MKQYPVRGIRPRPKNLPPRPVQHPGTGGFDWVDFMYGVRYWQGCRVKVDGRLGVVTSMGNHLMIRYDGERKPWPHHPTWHIEIVED